MDPAEKTASVLCCLLCLACGSSTREPARAQPNEAERNASPQPGPNDQMPEIERENFSWDGSSWKTTVALPMWAGFQSRGGPYGARDSDSPSEGRIEVVFAPEGRDESRLEDSEIQLVRHAVRNAAQMQTALLEGLLARYQSIREEYGGPAVRSVDEFRSLIGLHTIHVHQIARGGVPYVGFELGCTWDDEHGLGVLMHGTRVVEIGHADTAFLLWIATRDAGAKG